MSEVVQYLRVTTSQNLATAGLSYTTSFNCNFRLCQIFLKASTGITETITVNFVSKDGSNYDVVLDSTSLTNAQNYVFRPTGQCVFMQGDEIKVTCTNANNTGIVYLTIIAEPYGKQP